MPRGYNPYLKHSFNNSRDISVSQKRESDRRNGEKQAVLNLGFPRLQCFDIGRKISNDLTQLESREDLAELYGLTMTTDVTLDEIC